MPRRARFRIAAVEELHRQLQFAPVEAREREMIAAEDLVADIDPDRAYPEDFVVFRITGYRPEESRDAVTFAGAALLGDLCTLVLRLSATLRLPADHRGRRAIPIDAVAERLSVSSKTLQRYRRLGLVCHYVQSPGGHRLVCFEDAIDRFTDRHGSRIARAATFTRVGAEDERRIVEAARALAARERLSLNAAARRLARREGRAHETIRALLLRADRAAADPIFTDGGPLDERDERLAERAWRRGVPVRAIAQRLGRTPATVRRILLRRRGERLRSHDLAWVDLPTFGRPDAEEVILAAPVVVAGLRPVTGGDAVTTGGGAADAIDPTEEAALVAAFNLLKRRAAGALAAMGPWPAAGTIDAIERDMRWASAVKHRLASLALPAAMRAVEQHRHRPLEEEPRERVVAMLQLAVEIVSEQIESLDPARGHRLGRRAAQGVDRALARSEPPAGPPRAAARHAPGALEVTGLLRGLTPWQEALDLPPRLEARLPRLSPDLRAVLIGRHGLDGHAPRTPAEMATALGQAPATVARRLRDAELALRRLVIDADRR